MKSVQVSLKGFTKASPWLVNHGTF